MNDLLHRRYARSLRSDQRLAADPNTLVCLGCGYLRAPRRRLIGGQGECPACGDVSYSTVEAIVEESIRDIQAARNLALATRTLDEHREADTYGLLAAVRDG